MKKYLGAFFLLTSLAYASQELVIPMHKIDEKGMQEQIGTVKVTENKYGLVFTPDLQNLPTGVHGFHIHEHPDCEVSMQEGKTVVGGAAGGHYDPSGTKKHEGPWGEGHLGDLPVLYVNNDGKATVPVLAPRLKKLDEIKGRSIMIHEGGDNYSDVPAPLGGGGKRIACGVIEKTIDKK